MSNVIGQSSPQHILSLPVWSRAYRTDSRKCFASSNASPLPDLLKSFAGKLQRLAFYRWIVFSYNSRCPDATIQEYVTPIGMSRELEEKRERDGITDSGTPSLFFNLLFLDDHLLAGRPIVPGRIRSRGDFSCGDCAGDISKGRHRTRC